MKTVRTPGGDVWHIRIRPSRRGGLRNPGPVDRDYSTMPVGKTFAWIGGISLMAIPVGILIPIAVSAILLLATKRPGLAALPTAAVVAAYLVRLAVGSWLVRVTRPDTWRKEESRQWLERSWFAARRKARDVERELTASGP